MRDWVGRKSTPVNSASLAEAGEAGTQLQSGIARLADVASRLTAQIGDFLAEVKALRRVWRILRVPRPSRLLPSVRSNMLPED
jgi:hypothetical protein